MGLAEVAGVERAELMGGMARDEKEDVGEDPIGGEEE